MDNDKPKVWQVVAVGTAMILGAVLIFWCMTGISTAIKDHVNAASIQGVAAQIEVQPGWLENTVIVTFEDGSSATGVVKKGDRIPAPGEKIRITNGGYLEVDK